MKIRKSTAGEAGFTLVELIVSMAILGIIISMLYSVFSHNLKMYGRTAEAMDEQSALRMAAYQLTEEFRNIGYIDLANHDFADTAAMGAINATDFFIFHGSSGIKKGSAATSIFNMTNTEVTGMDFSLTQRGSKFYLGITLTGNTDTYTTEVLLNNILTNTAVQMDSSDIGNSGYTSIQYNYNHPPVDTTIVTPGPTSHPVTTITVDGQGGVSSISASGGTLQMIATVEPPEALQSVTWSVDNAYATIDNNSGLLTAQSNGIVTVTATAKDGSGVTGSRQITISGQISALTLNAPGTTIVKKLQYSYTAAASGGVGPYFITISNYTSNNGVAPVVSGNTITWLTGNSDQGKVMNFTVTVTDSASPKHSYTTGNVTVTVSVN